MGGFGAMSSNQVASATMFFGDFSQAVIGEWGVLEIMPNPYDATLFKQGGVLLDADFNEWVDLLDRRLRARKLEETTSKGAEAGALREVQLSPEERAKFLAQLGREAGIAPPKEAASRWRRVKAWGADMI